MLLCGPKARVRDVSTITRNQPENINRSWTLPDQLVVPEICQKLRYT
jgi:hypothetical protein